MCIRGAALFANFCQQFALNSALVTNITRSVKNRLLSSITVLLSLLLLLQLYQFEWIYTCSFRQPLIDALDIIAVEAVAQSLSHSNPIYIYLKCCFSFLFNSCSRLFRSFSSVHRRQSSSLIFFGNSLILYLFLIGNRHLISS